MTFPREDVVLTLSVILLPNVRQSLDKGVGGLRCRCVCFSCQFLFIGFVLFFSIFFLSSFICFCAGIFMMVLVITEFALISKKIYFTC